MGRDKNEDWTENDETTYYIAVSTTSQYFLPFLSCSSLFIRFAALFLHWGGLHSSYLSFNIITRKKREQTGKSVEGFPVE